MRKSDFNVIKFLVIFFVLLQGFYLYVGITTKGGKIFFPFLAKYANFPEWLTVAIAAVTKFVLQAFGYNVYQASVSNVTIYGSRGINLAWGCLGMAAISLWIGFVLAHTSVWKYKLKWILAGVTAICVINIFRIVMIALSNYYNWAYMQNFNAHTSFNIITYVVILFFMYLFVKNYNTAKKAGFTGNA